MAAVQLEFSIFDETDTEVRIRQLQSQIDEMEESMGKVRRRLFYQLSEVQKICFNLQNENLELKKIIKEIKNETSDTILEEKSLFFTISSP